MSSIQTTIITPALRQYTIPDPSASTGTSVRSDVVLGSPSARCNGIGICRVMGQGLGDSVPCKHITATISVTPGGLLRFKFDKDQIDEQTKEQHFQWLLFQVTEPVRISIRMRRELAWASCWIQPGIYQVWETEDAMIVDIPGEKTLIEQVNN